MLDASNHAQNPALHSRMQFDTLTAFAPVSLLRVPNVLVVTPSYEVKTVADLIKLGQPDQRAMSTSPRPVPARPAPGRRAVQPAGQDPAAARGLQGGGPAMIDVMSGQVPVMFASMGSAWQHVKNGKLRAVALGGSTRSPAARTCPPSPNPACPATRPMNGTPCSPAGTPPEVVTQLSQALAKVLKDPAIAEQLAGIGAEPIGSTPAELDTFRRAEIEKWQRVVSNLKLD